MRFPRPPHPAPVGHPRHQQPNPIPPTTALVAAMLFVLALTALSHDPHLAVVEALALLAGVNQFRRRQR